MQQQLCSCSRPVTLIDHSLEPLSFLVSGSHFSVIRGCMRVSFVIIGLLLLFAMGSLSSARVCSCIQQKLSARECVLQPFSAAHPNTLLHEFNSSRDSVAMHSIGAARVDDPVDSAAMFNAIKLFSVDFVMNQWTVKDWLVYPGVLYVLALMTAVCVGVVSASLSMAILQRWRSYRREVQKQQLNEEERSGQWGEASHATTERHKIRAVLSFFEYLLDSAASPPASASPPPSASLSPPRLCVLSPTTSPSACCLVRKACLHWNSSMPLGKSIKENNCGRMKAKWPK